MGKRRDRRQPCARRVKLDLYMDDEPVQSEVESKEVDESAGDTVPSSNTQSGMQENPLSLLGQYSDDEVEDEQRKKEAGAVQVDDSKINEKVADFIAELETSGLLDTKESNVSEQKVEDSNRSSVNLISPSSNGTHRQKTKVASEDANEGSLVSMIGDVVQKVLAEKEAADNSDWKAVLDEGSGNYYYWNAVTGATTWDKPEYAVEVATGFPEVAAGFPEPPVSSETYTKAAEYQGYTPAGNDASYSAQAQYTEASYPTASTDPMSLIQLGETMLTRFKVLAGDKLLTLPLRVRLAIEAEIRLSDCKVLASQGITDGLYWSHMEAHMKRLESLRAVEEATLLAEMEQKDGDVDMEVDMDIDTGEAGPSLPRHEECAPPPPEPETVSEERESSSHETKSNSCNDLQYKATSNCSSTTEIGTVPTSSAIEAAAAAAKKAAKAVRPKKKTTGLSGGKVNKKVSSLVNKWIAVKEEMHESDEENDDDRAFDLEAQEKKRQREIEEWRRDQIASGQALDNVNFQPLGPIDWRERVKRARREDKTKSTAAEATRPNLEELSKGLPPGWKAYWDGNSRDVYYGNLSTSETTWDRPTR